ncbi:MAG: YcxB family protein [Clostridiales bacterium]|nr:YcxB family protein [Clostridiales bacterium]
MFEFKGRRSKEILKASRVELCKSLKPLIIGGIIYFLVTLIYLLATKTYMGLWALLFFFVLAVLMGVIGFTSLLSKNSIDKLYENVKNDSVVIRVYNNRFIYQSKNQKYEYNISKITRIEDYGDYYAFSFKRWKHSGLICPKSWLCYGSIEEFENLFKNKLVDKTKNQNSK